MPWQILTRSYTHSICGPSRTALLTSRLAVSLGHPFPINDVADGGLDPHQTTMVRASRR